MKVMTYREAGFGCRQPYAYGWLVLRKLVSWASPGNAKIVSEMLPSTIPKSTIAYCTTLTTSQWLHCLQGYYGNNDGAARRTT